jgi:hypothetical protein
MRESFVVVITLVFLMVMTTMGIGLYTSTKQAAKQVNISSNRTESLYSAETCIVEITNWFKGQNAVPCQAIGIGNSCYSIGDTKMKKWALSNEKDRHRKKMEKQGYSCNISLLRIESVAGKNVGNQLGQSRSKQKKYIYKVNSKGYVNSSMDEVEVFFSTVF